jgi:hypothetical protein
MTRFLAAFLIWLGLSTAQAQIIGSLPYTLTNGTTADAGQVMANYAYIISQVNANAAKAGANSNITSIVGLTTPLAKGQGGSATYVGGTSTGTANVQAVATGITPAGFTLSAGNTVEFIAGYTNTGALTLAYNGTPATAVLKLSASGLIPLSGGEIVAGNPVVAFFDGTQFDLLTPYAFNLFGKVSTLSSNTTTDLGTSPTHIISISGATTITSFGSSAQTDYPLYLLTFSGSLTLTYNATSLILPGKVSIVTQANDSATAIYLGSGNWLVTSYTPFAVPPASMGLALASAMGFVQSNNASTPTTKVDLNVGNIIVTNSSNRGIAFSSPSTCTIDFTTTGAAGLDTGSLTTSTWYYTYYISNGAVLSCLGSLSATSPSMPSGYTFSMRVGAISTDGSSHFYNTLQKGKRAGYVTSGSGNTTAFPFTISGSTSGWTAFQVTGNAYGSPATATECIVELGTPATSNIAVAPSTHYNYGTLGSAAYENPAPVYLQVLASEVAATKTNILLESNSIYYQASVAGGHVDVVGWVDSVNTF